MVLGYPASNRGSGRLTEVVADVNAGKIPRVRRASRFVGLAMILGITVALTDSIGTRPAQATPAPAWTAYVAGGGPPGTVGLVQNCHQHRWAPHRHERCPRRHRNHTQRCHRFCDQRLLRQYRYAHRHGHEHRWDPHPSRIHSRQYRHHTQRGDGLRCQQRLRTASHRSTPPPRPLGLLSRSDPVQGASPSHPTVRPAT